MKLNSKIFLAGHNGLVGSAIFKKLKEKNYKNILVKNRKSLDLSNQNDTIKYFKKTKPEYVILAAARVGGINANQNFPAEFLYQNLSIEINVIHAAYMAGVKNLLFLGSSCVYPKSCKQPIKEEYLLTSVLEKSNEPYSIAKISGIKLCEYYSKQYKLNYFSVMPSNVYGPNDNYDLQTSHFIPALIKKIHDAKKKNKKYIEIWGSGKPLREAIYSEDLADACIFLLKKKHGKNLINIGSKIEYSIIEYAYEIMKILNYKCKIKHDRSKPDGVLRKKLDNRLINSIGWKKKINFKENILKTYEAFSKPSNV